MFEVLNQDNVVCFKTENFSLAKIEAQRMKEELSENFTVWEIKQVWTTQSLEEAINEK